MSQTFQDILLDHYGERPDQCYVRCVFPDGEDAEVTYRRLVERGSQFSRLLDHLSVPADGIILVMLPHSADLYCAFFGAMLGGRIPSMLAVPSFKLNPEHYRQELAALQARIGAGALITDRATAEHLELRDGHHGSRLILADELAPEAVPVVTSGAKPDDIALLQHSSGSTGLKKGVALSHRAVLAQIRAYAPTLGLREGDRIATWLPLYHDMGLVACTLLPVVLGIPVTALSPLHWVARPSSLFQIIAEDRCTLTWMPNFAYDFLAQRIRASQLNEVDLSSMRGWINCSEPTIAGSHRRFLERYQPMGVRPETLWTCYAAAETTFAISQSADTDPPRVECIDRQQYQVQKQAVPVADEHAPTVELLSGGTLVPGTEIRILDETGAALPDRCVGEIAIRAEWLFSGYFRDPETTANVLRDGWYYSGDLGYLADGHVFITGRKKDLIIIAGKNYYPQDIERIVCEVPGVYKGRVVALGMDDPRIGTQRLIVLAEVNDPSLVDSPEVAAEVRARLSEDLDCVIDDLRLLPHMWLLKTSSGKIARQPNLQRYLSDLKEPELLAAGRI